MPVLLPGLELWLDEVEPLDVLVELDKLEVPLELPKVELELVDDPVLSMKTTASRPVLSSNGALTVLRKQLVPH